MIARGSFGQPWIFDQTRDLLEGRRKRPDPGVAERFGIALDHARMAADYELDPRGAAIEFRKHLGWYAKGLPGSAELRKKLHAVTSLGEIEGIFADYLRAAERGEEYLRSTERGEAPEDGSTEDIEALEVLGA
jgi:tRNA-dihydrouridine synthase B